MACSRGSRRQRYRVISAGIRLHLTDLLDQRLHGDRIGAGGKVAPSRVLLHLEGCRLKTRGLPGGDRFRRIAKNAAAVAAIEADEKSGGTRSGPFPLNRAENLGEMGA